MNFINKALSFIFPPVCGFCENFCKSYLCNDCKSYLDELYNFQIELNEDKNIYYDELIYGFYYRNEIRIKIIEYKFHEKSYLYRTFFEYFCSKKEIINKIQEYDLLIPVPIHKNRKAERGYNQSELICKELSKYINIKENKIIYEKNIIKKSKNIKPQSTLNMEERIENVKQAYEISNKSIIKDKNIILFDDVYTTGSTVNECCKILKKAGCNKITVFVIAKNT